MDKRTQFKGKDFSPEVTGVDTHCRRTAAVARLIGRGLSLKPDEASQLEAACLLHHFGAGLFAPGAMQRLIADIFGEAAVGFELQDRVAPPVRQILQAYEHPGGGSAAETRLAGILRLADAIDQEMEAQPLEGHNAATIISGLRGGVEAGLWPEDALVSLERARRELPAKVRSARLGPFPDAAMRAVKLMRDPEASLADVNMAAGLDPAITGTIMRLANSAMFGSRMPASTLNQAITRLGFATSQKVILSAALRPMFGIPRLYQIWKESVMVADIADQLANRAGDIDSSEAYVAGLLHEIGAIALLSLPVEDAARLDELVAGGCPRVYAEDLLFGTDHAALGAQIAADWRLPENIVAAIRCHHRPETSSEKLPSLLYLAQQLNGAEEDLPSLVRLEGSLRTVGLTWEQSAHCLVSDVGAWLAAA